MSAGEQQAEAARVSAPGRRGRASSPSRLSATHRPAPVGCRSAAGDVRPHTAQVGRRSPQRPPPGASLPSLDLNATGLTRRSASDQQPARRRLQRRHDDAERRPGRAERRRAMGPGACRTRAASELRDAERVSALLDSPSLRPPSSPRRCYQPLLRVRPGLTSASTGRPARSSSSRGQPTDTPVAHEAPAAAVALGQAAGVSCSSASGV